MRYIFMILAIILEMNCLTWAELYPENIFGLDIPARRWCWNTDASYFSTYYEGSFGQGSDLANIRFVNGSDTTDIILVIDYGQSKILWLRVNVNGYQRTLQHIGTYGEFGSGPGQFITLFPMAVASTGEIYDPTTNSIFVGDRMNRSVAKLNFELYPGSPESDQIIWESSTFVDSNFAPTDLEYVDFGTESIDDNKLFALDDMGNRLVVFSHEGDFYQILDLLDPDDPLTHIYSGMAHKVNPNGSVTFYLADCNLSNVRRYVYSRTDQLSYENEINLGDRMETTISDVLYSDMFGLWAIENRGPHLYRIAENLSRVLIEVSGEQFDPQNMFHIQKVRLLPDRLVIFEEMGDDTGILSFAFNLPSGKRENEAQEIIPFIFALNQNYPNPFNPNTIIEFEIPSAQWVTLEIFNILGQEVKTLVDQNKNAGHYSILWDGTNNSGKKIASGVYFSRLSAGDRTEIKKMLLLK
jgi:hypothetical protein